MPPIGLASIALNRRFCHHFTQKEGIAPHPYRHVFDFIHEVDALRLGATLGQDAGVFSEAAKVNGIGGPIDSGRGSGGEALYVDQRISRRRLATIRLRLSSSGREPGRIPER